MRTVLSSMLPSLSPKAEPNGNFGSPGLWSPLSVLLFVAVLGGGLSWDEVPGAVTLVGCLFDFRSHVNNDVDLLLCFFFFFDLN